MLNRSEVLKAAWNAYRNARPAIFAAGDETGVRCFLRPLFSRLLVKAWADAKAAARNAAARAIAADFVVAQKRVALAKAAAMPAADRSVAISRARDELALLDFAPLAVRTANRRADLQATLSTLAAV